MRQRSGASVGGVETFVTGPFVLCAVGSRQPILLAVPHAFDGQNGDAAVIPTEHSTGATMHPLSEHARLILDHMEPDRRYEPQDLRAFVLDTSIEHLREIMHELWVNRHVERVGYSAWRRHRSLPPHVPRPVAGEIEPDYLFDHTTFPEFFK